MGAMKLSTVASAIGSQTKPAKRRLMVTTRSPAPRELEDRAPGADEGSERGRAARRAPRRVEPDVKEDGGRIPPHDLNRMELGGEVLRGRVDDGDEGDGQALIPDSR